MTGRRPSAVPWSHETADTDVMTLIEPLQIDRLPTPEVAHHFGQDARALWQYHCAMTGRDDILGLVH